MSYSKNPLIILSLLLVICLAGCATVSEGPVIPLYSINGINYMPLVPLCQSKGITWQYDSLTRTAILSKGEHKVNLMVGDRTVLVDGEPRLLNHPVDIYQGTVVVPSKMEEILDSLIVKEGYTYAKPQISLSRIKKVVIDAGHGGNDPGAIGRTGLREKVINLDIAKRLAKIFEDDGLQVIMTRSNDRFISLERRVEVANNQKADLFISIHSNAARSRSLCGFEVYYVAPSVSDSKRAALTARSASLNLKDTVFSSDTQDLRVIVWDMIYTNSRAESIELARSLCKVMDSSIDANILGVKNARFQVLKGITMPGILIEVGFVSNLYEEKLLRTSAYREKLAAGILEGIREYSQDMELVEMASR